MAKNHQTENPLFRGLIKRYEAEIAEAYATLVIYFDNSVGIGDHPNLLEEMDKLVGRIADAEDKIKAQELILEAYEAEVADRASARQREMQAVASGSSDIL